MQDQFDTPILLITFNRPNHTRQVFEAIKKRRPKYLYVFQDGARAGNADDVEKCAAVRAIFVEPLGWDCELKTYYSDRNLGCGRGPVTGISWFFEQVEMGIIMEDDAVPHLDFFEYASQLLGRYAADKDVRAIGSMKIDKNTYGDASYYFSMMNRNLCAWATWRRAWLDFDYELKAVSELNLKKAFDKYHTTTKEFQYWRDTLVEIHKDCLGNSSWDVQFLMSIWIHNGKGICANTNLSTNIGFDPEGTHTTHADSAAANLPSDSILPIIHPSDTRINRKSDLNYHKLYFQPYEYGVSGLKRELYRLIKRFKDLLVSSLNR